MDGSRLLKLVVIVALLFVAWKYGLPWVKEKTSHASATTATAPAPDSSCVGDAERASAAWGGGIGRFANPPYDIAAWSSFTDGVKSNISAAESACSCPAESCTKVRAAMSDLRSLVSDLDSAIRTGGSPPEDIVRRQESIDSRIDEARELVRAGK